MRLSEKVRAKRTAHYRDMVESIVSGRRWIVGDAIEVSASRIGEKLLSFGAEAVLVIAGNRGTGASSSTDAGGRGDDWTATRRLRTGARNATCVSGKTLRPWPI